MAARVCGSRARMDLGSCARPVLRERGGFFGPRDSGLNQRVNEQAPFAATSDSHPLYTGLRRAKRTRPAGVRQSTRCPMANGISG